ncbi:MAG: hypothetical protein ABI047_03140 [Jatrophihabitantaceae bacterium]
MWMGDENFSLALAAVTLVGQLEHEHPGPQWQRSPQTGSIGNDEHVVDGWEDSDHNGWLDRTVRAVDIATNVTGVPGIVDVTDGPSGSDLLMMWNRMYAAKDPRVYPDGYGIFNGFITDRDNPGQARPHRGDPHLYHFHGSLSTDPAGFNSTVAWPLITRKPTTPPPDEELEMVIIHPIGRPGLPALSNGYAATRLQDAVSIVGLRSTGVRVAPISERDFASQLRAGRK